MCAMTGDTSITDWVSIFERVGPGTLILVTVVYSTVKLMPSVVALLAAWKAQSERITESVPTALEGLRDLVQHAERIADHVTRPTARDGEGAGVRHSREHSDLSPPSGC